MMNSKHGYNEKLQKLRTHLPFLEKLIASMAKSNTSVHRNKLEVLFRFISSENLTIEQIEQSDRAVQNLYNQFQQDPTRYGAILKIEPNDVTKIKTEAESKSTSQIKPQPINDVVHIIDSDSDEDDVQIVSYSRSPEKIILLDEEEDEESIKKQPVVIKTELPSGPEEATETESNVEISISTSNLAGTSVEESRLKDSQDPSENVDFLKKIANDNHQSRNCLDTVSTTTLPVNSETTATSRISSQESRPSAASLDAHASPNDSFWSQLGTIFASPQHDVSSETAQKSQSTNFSCGLDSQKNSASKTQTAKENIGNLQKNSVDSLGSNEKKSTSTSVKGICSELEKETSGTKEMIEELNASTKDLLTCNSTASSAVSKSLLSNRLGNIIASLERNLEISKTATEQSYTAKTPTKYPINHESDENKESASKSNDSKNLTTYNDLNKSDVGNVIKDISEKSKISAEESPSNKSIDNLSVKVCNTAENEVIDSVCTTTQNLSNTNKEEIPEGVAEEILKLGKLPEISEDLKSKSKNLSVITDGTLLVSKNSSDNSDTLIEKEPELSHLNEVLPEKVIDSTVLSPVDDLEDLKNIKGKIKQKLIALETEPDESEKPVDVSVLSEDQRSEIGAAKLCKDEPENISSNSKRANNEPNLKDSSASVKMILNDIESLSDVSIDADYVNLSLSDISLSDGEIVSSKEDGIDAEVDIISHNMHFNNQPINVTDAKDIQITINNNRRIEKISDKIDNCRIRKRSKRKKKHRHRRSRSPRITTETSHSPTRSMQTLDGTESYSDFSSGPEENIYTTPRLGLITVRLSPKKSPIEKHHRSFSKFSDSIKNENDKTLLLKSVKDKQMLRSNLKDDSDRTRRMSDENSRSSFKEDRYRSLSKYDEEIKNEHGKILIRKSDKQMSRLNSKISPNKKNEKYSDEENSQLNSKQDRDRKHRTRHSDDESSRSCFKHDRDRKHRTQPSDDENSRSPFEDNRERKQRSRYSDDEDFRSSSKDIRERKHRTHSPKHLSDDERRDRWRSPKRSPSNTNSKKLHYGDDERKYRRSPKRYSALKEDDRYKWRQRSRSPPRRLADLEKKKDTKYDKDEDSVKRLLARSIKSSIRLSPSRRDSAEKENHHRNSDKIQENRSQKTSQVDSEHSESLRNNEKVPSKTSKSEPTIEVIILDDEPDLVEDIDFDKKINEDKVKEKKQNEENEEFGIAIEVSDDDEIVEPPPPPIISPIKDLVTSKELKHTTENDESKKVADTHTEEKSNVTSINKFFTESLELVTESRILKKPESENTANLTKNQIDEAGQKEAEKSLTGDSKVIEAGLTDLIDEDTASIEQLISDLTTDLEEPPSKSLEEKNLNELQEIRIKLENEIGIPTDVIIKSFEAISSKATDAISSLPAEQLPFSRLASTIPAPRPTVTVAQPSPKDPRLNRIKPAPVLTTSPLSNVVPPPPLIPKLSAAIAMPVPSTSFAVPYHNAFETNPQQELNTPSELDNTQSVTYGEYKRLKRLKNKITPKRRKSIADWEAEKSRNHGDESSTTESDESASDDLSESSESDSSSGKSRKSSKNLHSRKKGVVTKKWVRKFFLNPEFIQTLKSLAVEKNIEIESSPVLELEPAQTVQSSAIQAPVKPPQSKKDSVKSAAVQNMLKKFFDKDANDPRKARGRSILPGPEPEPMKKRRSFKTPPDLVTKTQPAKKSNETSIKELETTIPSKPIRKDAIPKRMNELEKLNSDIAKLKNGDDIASMFGRRTSSINSENKTKEMTKMKRRTDVNQIVSSNSEAEETTESKSKISAKKKHSRRIISDDDDTDEYTPPAVNKPNIEQPDQNLLTPLKEVPFAEKTKRGRKSKQEAGTSRKKRRSVIPKNTDVTLHFNSPLSQKCAICKENQQQIVAHYVNKHREHEVFVARLDICQVKDLMAKPLYAIPVSNSNVRFQGTCVFCLRVISETMANFMEHFGAHTGEFAYECDTCELRFARKRNMVCHCNSQCEKGAKLLSVYSYDLSSNIIKAYVCKLCNYIQLNSANVVKHMRTEHDKQSVTTDDYIPLTILEIRDNIEEIENDEEEDIEVDIEVANEAIKAEDATKPVFDCEESVLSANDNSQSSQTVPPDELKEEMTFDDGDLLSLEKIFNDETHSLPPDTCSNVLVNDSSVFKPEPKSDDETEIIFVIETASDLNNYQSAIKYQKAIGQDKPIMTKIHTSIDSDIDPIRTMLGTDNAVPSTPIATSGDSRSDDESSHDVYMPSDSESQSMDIESQPETQPIVLPAPPVAAPSTSSAKHKSTSQKNRSISQIMNVGFQKIGTNAHKYYCLIEKCSFQSTETIAELRDHVNTAHDTKWSGRCKMCSKRVVKKSASLDREIDHLVSEHILENGEKTSKKRRQSSKSDSSAVTNMLKPWLMPSKCQKSKDICTALLKEYHLKDCYKCMGPECLFTTPSPSEMQLHLTLHHSDDVSALECCYCDERFSLGNMLVDHISRTHGSSIYQCSHCFYRSCAAYNVQLHQRLCHENVAKTNILVVAGKSQTLLTEVMAILDNRQQNVRPIDCPGCQERFYIKQFLEEHIKKKHPSLMNKEFYCPTYDCFFCSFGTTKLQMIRTHMCNTHPNRLLYACGRVFIKDRHPLASQANFDMLGVKSTCLVFLGFTVSKFKSNAEEKNLIEAVNSGRHPNDLNEKIRITYGESVVNFSDVETYVKNLALDIQPDSKNFEESELDQLVSAAIEGTGLIGKDLYRCGFPNCTESCNNFNQFDRHILTHSSGKKELIYTCPHCDIIIPRTQIRLHTIIHRQHRYICYYCADTSASQALAIEHLKKAHSQHTNVFVFLTCDKRWDQSANEQESRIFISLSRQDSEASNVVEIMTNVLRKRYGPDKDIHEDENVTDERPESPIERKEETIIPVFVALETRLCCKIDGCPFKAKTDLEIQAHISERHKIILSGKYTCPHCPYELNHCALSINRIKNHLLYHGPVIIVCDVCNYYNYNRNVVLKHIDNCHPYNFVTMTIITRTSLAIKNKIEILYNTSIRSPEDKYKCTLCEAILTECEEFYLHMKGLHQLNVRFKCDHCAFLDNALESVKAHLKIAHANKVNRVRSVFMPVGGKWGQNLSPFELLVDSDNRVTEQSLVSENVDANLPKPPAETKSTEKKTKDTAPKSTSKRKTESTKECKDKRRRRNEASEPKDQIDVKPDHFAAGPSMSGMKMKSERFINSVKPPSRPPSPPPEPFGLKMVPIEKLLSANTSPTESLPPTVPTAQLHLPVPVAPLHLPVRIAPLPLPVPIASLPVPVAPLPVPVAPLPVPVAPLPVPAAPLPPPALLQQITPNHIYLVCHVCEDKFNDMCSFHGHWATKHPGYPFHYRVSKKLLCVYCEFYERFYQMKIHHSEKHGEELFITREAHDYSKCSECSFRFKEIIELRVHTEQQHPQLHLAMHPSFDFLNQQLLHTLIRHGMPSILFICFNCKNIYPRKSSCIAHIQRSHASCSDPTTACKPYTLQKTLYGCNKCEIFFELEKSAVKHIRKHIMPYGCNYCEVTFANHRALENHYLLLHKKSNLSYRSIDILHNINTFKQMLLLFPNGLILSKAETEFNDYGRMSEFEQMIEAMEKSELKLWIEKEERRKEIESVAEIKRELEIEGNLVCPP